LHLTQLLVAIPTRGNSVVVSIARRLKNAGMAFERAAKFHDFQAEYEGSIPFTRSNPLPFVLKSVTMALKKTVGRNDGIRLVP
jgi:hypothetical protein